MRSARLLSFGVIMGGQRRFRASRCEGCGLHEELCACALLPRVELDTPLVVVQHNKDSRKPTNTVRVLTRSLVSCEVTRYAVRGEVFDPGPIEGRPDVDWCLLFPEVEEEALAHPPPRLNLAAFRRPGREGRRRGVVIVDGTWSQARRMRRRIEVLRTMPTFELPPAPTQWTVREQAAQARSTAEGHRALAICGGPGRCGGHDLFQRGERADDVHEGAHLRPQVPPTWTDEIRFDDPAVLDPDVLDPDVLTGSPGDEPSRDV